MKKKRKQIKAPTWADYWNLILPPDSEQPKFCAECGRQTAWKRIRRVNSYDPATGGVIITTTYRLKCIRFLFPHAAIKNRGIYGDDVEYFELTDRVLNKVVTEPI